MGKPIGQPSVINDKLRSVVELLHKYETTVGDIDLEKFTEDEDFLLRNKEVFRDIGKLENSINTFLECLEKNEYMFTQEEKRTRAILALIMIAYGNIQTI